MSKTERVPTQDEKFQAAFIRQLQNVEGIFVVEMQIVRDMTIQFYKIQEMPQSKQRLQQMKLVVLSREEFVRMQPQGNSLNVPELMTRIKAATIPDLPTNPSLLELILPMEVHCKTASDLKNFLIKALALFWLQALQYTKSQGPDLIVQAFLNEKAPAETTS